MEECRTDESLFSFLEREREGLMREVVFLRNDGVVDSKEK